MNTLSLFSDAALQQVLCAAFEQWISQAQVPHNERRIGYSGAVTLHRARFGGDFHQTTLCQLERMGLLAKAESTRQQHRRYYRLVDPNLAYRLLVGCGLVKKAA